MPIRKIELNDFDPDAIAVYERFRGLPRAEHIAKPATLHVLARLCRRERLERVLELGGGLGTISYLLLKGSPARLDVYEHDPYFAGKLAENLREFSGRFQILNDYRLLPPLRDYDLVVVDGGQARKGEDDPSHGFNESVWHYLSYLKNVRFVYVEGHRHIQRTWVRKALARRYRYSLERHADTQYQGEVLNGGVLIACRPSNSRLGKLLNYLFWEVVEWQTVRNFFVYRFRRIKLALSK